jgi:hypothetical protein
MRVTARQADHLLTDRCLIPAPVLVIGVEPRDVHCLLGGQRSPTLNDRNASGR